MRVINNNQQMTAETWEIAGDVINSQKMPVLFKDENGIYHTMDASYSTVIIDGTGEFFVLSGEIVEPQPVA